MPTREEEVMGQLAAQDAYEQQAAQDAFAAFAARTQRSVMPEGGRTEAPGQILGPVVHALGEPIRKGQGLLQTMRDYSANEFPETMGAIAQTTDYDPRRGAADYAAGTAFNLVTNPMRVPAAAGEVVLGAGARDPRLWSPISKTKLPKPLDEFEHRFTDVRTPVPKIVDPSSLVGGHLVLTPGDLSATNRTATHIDLGGKNPERLDFPVTAQGGVGFPEANPGMAWASERPIARKLDNQAAKLAETGKPVYIAPMTMSPTGIDASHHVADPLSQLVQSADISKKDAASFDKLMRKKDKEWPGVQHANLQEYLDSLEGGMKLKSYMANRMALNSWQEKGFPNVGAVRHAMSDPGLIDLPRNTTGMAISRYNPGQGLRDTEHLSYSKGVAGEHMGQLASLLPFDVAAPDISKGLAAINARNLAAGAKNAITPRYHLEKPTAGVPTSQYMDDKWLEGVMKYLERAGR